MEYDAGQTGLGTPLRRDSGRMVRSLTQLAWRGARTNPGTLMARIMATVALVVPQFSCVFDGLTGARPDPASIHFTIAGPDTIGVDDTLAFRLTDVEGFAATGVRILWSSSARAKAQWVRQASDSLDDAVMIVRTSLESALATGVDTGSTWITATLIAPELSDPIADSVAMIVAPKLSFTTQPRDSISTGEILAVTVSVLDGRGEAISIPRRVTLSLGLLNNSDSLVRVVDRADTAATFFFGDAIVETIDGVATYDAVKIYTPGSGYTLVATSGRLTRASSIPFRVGQLILRLNAGDDQSDTVDTQLDIPPSVQLVNELGRPVRGRSVKFRITDGNGQLSDTIAVTSDSGVASVEWRLGTVAGDSNNVVEAVVPNATDVQPVRFAATALPDRPAELDLVTAPSSSATCGVPFNVQPVVQLTDRFDNRSFDSLVSVTAESVSGGGMLGGTTTITTNSVGRAVFTDLWIDGDEGDHDLNFVSPGLDPTESVAIELNTGPPAQLTIITQPPGAVEADEEFPTDPEVFVEDQCGNPLQGMEVTVTIASGDGVLNGDNTDNTNSSGVASFNGLSITPLDTNPGDYPFTLQFAVQGIQPVISNTIVVTVPQPTPPGEGATRLNPFESVPDGGPRTEGNPS